MQVFTATEYEGRINSAFFLCKQMMTAKTKGYDTKRYDVQ